MDVFNNLFGKTPSLKEQQRENDRNLRKATRDIEREGRKLAEEEKKLELEIRRNAAQGNNDTCRILAKQLVEIRKQKSRSCTAKGKIQSIGYQNKNMGANIALSGAMSSTAKTMADMNKVMKPESIAANVREFQQANMRMELTDELINDTLDEMLNDSDDEQESNAVISKVLDEIGIEISGKMAGIPATGASDLAADRDATPSTDEIAQSLARLRST